MSFASVWRGWRAKVHDILEVGDGNQIGRVVNVFLIVLIIANGLAFAAETVSSVYQRWGPELEAFNIFSVLVFTVEYVLRLWSSVEIPLYRRMPHWRARLNFALRPMMIIDLLAILPFYVYLLVPFDLRALRILRLFRLFRLLKLLRYSPALLTLKRVVTHEYRALLGALLLMMMLMLFSAAIIYFLERGAQPDKFGSIPAAAWWALATLTTIGYGDIVPITPWGKVFGGIVMLFGLGMFALPIAILATGFSQEFGAARVRGDLEHGGARAAVLDARRGRGGRSHQVALHAALSGRRHDRARRRSRRGHVFHRQRRGHGVRGAWPIRQAA